MTKEQEDNNHKRWNIESLKEYMDFAMFTLKEKCEDDVHNLDVKIDQRFDAMEKAVGKAEIAHEKRLESMNEFRGQLMDQSKTFVPRLEFELIAKKVEKMENIKQGGAVMWGYIVGVTGFLIALITIALKLLGK